MSAKQNSKVMKKVEIRDSPKTDSPPLEHRITSSIYPWYYVPGNSYLTAKRLSTKYDKESRRQKQNEEIDNYFRLNIFFHTIILFHTLLIN